MAEQDGHAVALQPAPDDSAGRWLPSQQAARILGISERTLRRYVATGTYPVRRRGRRVQVFVPEQDFASAAPHADVPPDDPVRLAIQALIEALNAERSRSERLEARVSALEAEQRHWCAKTPPYRWRRRHAVPDRI